MSFQAYLDTIKAKTGKTPQEFRELAAQKGLLEPGVKAAQVIAWLKHDFGLGRGHAMAIVDTFKQGAAVPSTEEDRIERHFRGGRARWRPVFDRLLAELRSRGADPGVSPTDSYLSLLRGAKKFGIVQVAAARIDVGIKLREAPAHDRLEPAGNWNTMVTHRVRVSHARELDDQLLGWLQAAYEAA